MRCLVDIQYSSSLLCCDLAVKRNVLFAEFFVSLRKPDFMALYEENELVTLKIYNGNLFLFVYILHYFVNVLNTQFSELSVQSGLRIENTSFCYFLTHLRSSTVEL